MSNSSWGSPTTEQRQGTNKLLQLLGVLLFALGMCLMLVVITFALWPDFEAAVFDVTHSGGEPLKSLHCPWLITPADQTAIRLTLSNPLDQPVNFLVRARISQGFATFMREENAQAIVSPGQSTQFVWLVKPEDAVYGRMVLARVRVLRTRSLPARQQSCGILVLNVPWLRGNVIMGGLLAATLLSLGMGGVLWLRGERPLIGRKRELTRIVGLFALLLLLTMIMSLIGWWGSGSIILIVMVLFLAVIVERLR